MRSVHILRSTKSHWANVSPTCLASDTSAGLFFTVYVLFTFTFLPTFAPRALPRFNATMRALTPVQRTLPLGSDGQSRAFAMGLSSAPIGSSSSLDHTGLHIPRTHPSNHSVVKHPMHPAVALTRYPSARQTSPSTIDGVRTSLLSSALVNTLGRITFVILRTGCSFSVALHPASRRRSYLQLQTGERMSGEDFHLPECVRCFAQWIPACTGMTSSVVCEFELPYRP